jgi:hypothetical protein
LATTTRFVLFGHGLYEKALRPYVGMTGHALLLQTPAHGDFGNEPGLLAKADAWTANAVHERLAKPRDLSPLPVLGVPGWWDANNEAAFYDNAAYFRPGRMRGTSLGTAVARAGAVR